MEHRHGTRIQYGYSTVWGQGARGRGGIKKVKVELVGTERELELDRKAYGGLERLLRY